MNQQKTLQQFNQVIIILGPHIEDNKLVITTETKNFYFDLPKDVGSNFKHEIDSIIKYNDILAEHTIKNKINQLLFKYKHGNDIHEHGKQ